MAQLSLRNICKSYGDIAIIKALDLEIIDGEFLVLVGPSGCGKSTLLRMIAGIEEITDGTLSIDGQVVNDLPASKRELSMVFQSYALYPHMSVRKNLAFGLQNLKMPRKEIDSRVTEVARVLQIEPLLDRKPRQLSGGQKQRVAIGRSIVREPKLFLFDEPLSNLDAELRVQMRAELAALYQRLKTTMVYVTHDQVEAMTLASRIVVLRAGKIEQLGTPVELYTKPANLFVAGFIGSPKMNKLAAKVAELDGTVTAQLADFPDLEIHAPEQAGKDITVCVRPEDLEIGSGEYQAEGSIKLLEYLGGETLIHLDLDSGQSLLIQDSTKNQHSTGQRISIGFNMTDLHFFDRAGLRFECGQAATA